MLILLILYFLQHEGNAYSQLRNYASHNNYYDTPQIFIPINRRARHNGFHENIRSRYTHINNGIGTSHNEADNIIDKQPVYINNMGTKDIGMDKIKSSLNNLLTLLSPLLNTNKNSLLTDIVELAEYLETRLPTRLSEVIGILRAIYVLIRESLTVVIDQLPNELSIVNDIFKFISSLLSGTLIKDLTKQLEADQGLYSFPQTLISQLSSNGEFSNNLLGTFSEPLFESITKLNTWAIDVLANITPLLPFEELTKRLESGVDESSVNRTSESLSTAPGDVYEAYQNTLKLYSKLDELTTGTEHHHIAKSLFKVMTRLLKLIYKHS